MDTKQKSNLLSLWGTELISSAIVLLCLFLAVYFPAQGLLQSLSRAFFILFLLPALYIKFILKQNLSDFGFNLRNPKVGFSWATGMLIVSFLIIFILIRFSDFENNYLIPAYLAKNFGLFLFYELIVINFILFLYEFFFKGFLLFSLTKNLGFLAIFIQALVFILFMTIIGIMDWEMAPTAILAFTGGIVAYKSRSFIYSYLMGLIFTLFLDAYIIHIFK
ncbi:MAG: hypothetical protein WC120_00125 [Parcubacteria group bacterium]